MSEEMNGLPAELRQVERRLARVRPARGAVDRDRVMYASGRAAGMRAGRARERMWQGAFAGLLVVCVGIGFGWMNAGGGRASVAQGLPGAARDSGGVAAVQGRAGGGASGAGTGGSLQDDWATISLPGMSPGALSQMLSGDATRSNGNAGDAGGSGAPALKKGDGLEAVPAWQRRSILKGSGL